MGMRQPAQLAQPVYGLPEGAVADQRSRTPSAVLPLMLRTEAAGEVQTPLRGRTADGLGIGDLVWLRHAKAGELCERFDELHLVQGDEAVDRVPTYRGEGRNFG